MIPAVRVPIKVPRWRSLTAAVNVSQSPAQSRLVLGPLRSSLMVNWSDVATWLAVLGAWATALAALWQLRLQRIQLEDQTRIQEREQANLVDVSASSVDSVKARVLDREPEGSEPFS